MNGKEEASIPINILVEDAPEYQRDYIIEEPSPIKEYLPEDFDQSEIIPNLLTMIAILIFVVVSGYGNNMTTWLWQILW